VSALGGGISGGLDGRKSLARTSGEEGGRFVFFLIFCPRSEPCDQAPGAFFRPRVPNGAMGASSELPIGTKRVGVLRGEVEASSPMEAPELA
jgi:hypothetical protein